jgi:glycosyltransferase involved in cell wall biosynthesis
MLTDLAEDLAAQGWDVRVITSRGRYASSGPSLAAREERNGVKIIRTASSTIGRARIIGRVTDYLTYVIGAALALARAPRGSIIVGMSDPPMLVALAVAGARLRGGKSVYWAQDVFPDIAARLGVLRQTGPLHRLLARFARAVHARCDAVVALGPMMAGELEREGAARARIATIQNWGDTAAIVPLPPSENPFVRANGLEGKFVVLYSGNAGRAHVFDAVIEAMRLLRDSGDIVFLFIGGGYRIAELKRAVAEHRLLNARFLDYMPREHLSFSLSAANVSLVTEDPRVVGLLVPSKTYGILASGRPIIFVGSSESDVAAVVRGADCGDVVGADEPRALAAAIVRLKNDPEEAGRRGARARGAAEQSYSRQRATKAWSDLLTALSISKER